MHNTPWEIERLLDEKYHGQKNSMETDGFRADRARLEAGEPLAYVIGHIPFLNATIHLDSHPLIPRTETEYWCEKVITEIQKRAIKAPRVLDLCAGSGCIGIAVLTDVPRAYVDFAEIDVGHHPTIQKNITENNIDVGRTQILGGDLFSSITATYDYILTNPPYIDRALDRTEKTVTDHEPHRALYGGEAGMEIISRIITEAPHYLTAGGTLIIEHEPEQTDAILVMARQNGFSTTTHKDQYRHDRYSVLSIVQ